MFYCLIQTSFDKYPENSVNRIVKTTFVTSMGQSTAQFITYLGRASFTDIPVTCTKTLTFRTNIRGSHQTLFPYEDRTRDTTRPLTTWLSMQSRLSAKSLNKRKI